MKLNITKEGIEAANKSVNSVLEAMGFESESEIEAPEQTENDTIDSMEQYGKVIETPIAHNVFQVSFEKQDLYLHDSKKSPEKFVGA